jgi:hypothetical protein
MKDRFFPRSRRVVRQLKHRTAHAFWVAAVQRRTVSIAILVEDDSGKWTGAVVPSLESIYDCFLPLVAFGRA